MIAVEPIVKFDTVVVPVKVRFSAVAPVVIELAADAVPSKSAVIVPFVPVKIPLESVIDVKNVNFPVEVSKP